MRLSIAHKISLLSILLVVVTAGVISGQFYSQTSQQLLNLALLSLADEIQEQGLKMQERIENQHQNILSLASIATIQNISQQRHDTTHTEQEGATQLQPNPLIKEAFQAILKHHLNYLQLRFIDSSGQEIVKVMRHNDQVIQVPPSQLQNKAGRDYVEETLKLPRGSVYTSEINLNREYGKIVQPHQEVLRTATPIYAEDSNTPIGLLVLNTEIGQELRTIQKAVQTAEREIIITNDHGGYLLHPDSSRTYGFDLGKRYRVQEDIPQLAPFFLPDNRLHQMVLLPKQTGSTSVMVYTKIPFDHWHPERFIAVGISQSYKGILAEQTTILQETITGSILLIIFGAGLAFLLSMRLAKPIRAMTQAVDDFTQHRAKRIDLPVEHSDEIGLLAQSFKAMIDQVEEAQLELRRLNLLQEYQIQERTHKLEESEAQQRTIMENIVDGLITIDIRGTIHSVNPAAVTIFGYSVDEMIGNNVKMLMPEPYHSEHDGYLDNYLQSGKKKVIGIGREVEGKHKDGTIFPLDLAVSEMEINGQRIYSGLVRDITERKRVDKMKNEFISTVSHELRTPLTSIRGSLGLLTGGAAGELPEQAKAMLGIASSNTERLLLLINDILDIQKIESGQMAFKFQCLELLPFLEQTIKEHEAYAEQHNVHFSLKGKLDPVQVFADRDRLMQVMANLLSNAAKFSPQGKAVEISIANLENRQIRISVTDHGPGIPKEFQPKLFDRFTQSDSSDTRQKGGTGLGLSIAKAIIEKHGGRIGFITHEGIGTTFYFDLAILTNSNLQTKTPQQLPTGSHDQVLIVEDDPDIAALLKRMLAEGGFNSDIADSTEEARQLLMNNPGQYKAITMDLALPGQNGISFINELRQTEATQKLPVVVVSATADEARQQLNGGAISVVDWLQKPIDQPRLLEAIKQAAGADHIPRILHVEDEADVHKIVSMMLQDHCELTWTTTLSASKEALATEPFDLVLLDIGLPDGSGLDLLETIERHVNPPRVVIFSAQDVRKEYADKVSAVLVKSRTDNHTLAEMIMHAIKQHSGN